MAPALMDPQQAAAGVGGLLLVLFVLIGILALVFGILRRILKWLVIVGLTFVVGGSLLFGFRARDAGPASTLDVGVRASVEGGWDVTLPSVDGATGYTIDLDGTRVGTAHSAGQVHVSDPVVPAKEYAFGPVHSVDVRVAVAEGNQVRASVQFCSPVVILAARGTNENPGKAQFGNGIGSRNWRTWMHLAEQAGVKPAAGGVVPTVIGAAPVHYPATAADYASSRDEGKVDLRKRWKSIVKDCPGSRVILSGYSQGADVIASVWMDQPAGSEQVDGVVLFADPHFDRAWVEQGIAWPQAAVYRKDRMLGGRGRFPEGAIDRVQAWCLPKDPVCQALPRPWGWHGNEYDVYEEWAAYNLAPGVVETLVDQGFPTTVPARPTSVPSTTGR